MEPLPDFPPGMVRLGCRHFWIILPCDLGIGGCLNQAELQIISQ